MVPIYHISEKVVKNQVVRAIRCAMNVRLKALGQVAHGPCAQAT